MIHVKKIAHTRIRETELKEGSDELCVRFGGINTHLKVGDNVPMPSLYH